VPSPQMCGEICLAAAEHYNSVGATGFRKFTRYPGNLKKWQGWANEIAKVVGTRKGMEFQDFQKYTDLRNVQIRILRWTEKGPQFLFQTILEEPSAVTNLLQQRAGDQLHYHLVVNLDGLGTDQERFCRACNKWLRHYEIHTCKKAIDCRSCRKKFTSRENLKKHQEQTINHHCKHCNKLLKYKECLAYHCEDYKPGDCKLGAGEWFCQLPNGNFCCKIPRDHRDTHVHGEIKCRNCEVYVQPQEGIPRGKELHHHICLIKSKNSPKQLQKFTLNSEYRVFAWDIE